MELEGALIFLPFFAGFLSVLVVGMDSGDTCYLKKLSEKVNQRWNAQLWNDVTVLARSLLGTAAIVLCAAALLVNACTWILNDVAKHGKRAVNDQRAGRDRVA